MQALQVAEPAAADTGRRSGRRRKIVYRQRLAGVFMYPVREYRAVVARKTLKSLKESTWNTIKSILKDWD